MATEAFSTARASEIIGMIYDCAIDPARWEQTIEEIRQELDFLNGLLFVNSLPSYERIFDIATRIPADYRKLLDVTGPTVPEMFGGVERLNGVPLDEPVAFTTLIVCPDWQDNPHYKLWVKPQGIIDSATVFFARDHKLLGSVNWSRHEKAGPIGERELESLRLLAPHFRRAISISQLLDMKTIAATTFARTLSTMTSAVVLVDEGLGIVHANVAAEAMLERGTPAAARGGCLVVAGEAAQAALASAVRLSAGAEAALGRRGLGVPLRDRGGAPHVAHVLPLAWGAVRPGLMPRAVAAVFFASTEAAPRMPGDALALLFDLTPAEIRIFEMIVEGRPPADIAHELGVKPSTVHTHLKRVFEKTGCSRQADLVRLANSLEMP
ncbi:MAG: helix-turn-helix transcriptional regulator [Hyphomicrobiaceae bacterium]